MGIIYATRLPRQVATSAAAWRLLKGKHLRNHPPNRVSYLHTEISEVCQSWKRKVIFAGSLTISHYIVDALIFGRQEWVPSCAKWIALCLRDSSKWGCSSSYKWTYGCRVSQAILGLDMIYYWFGDDIWFSLIFWVPVNCKSDILPFTLR
jgi:hypothetical protein